MKTLKFFAVLLLLGFCTPAPAQTTLTCTVGQTITIVCPGAQPPTCNAPNVLVNGVCTPPAPSACPNGMNAQYNFSSMATGRLIPPSPATVSGAAGFSIQFVVRSDIFPRGFKFTGSDESPNEVGKEMVIGACPGVFTPVNGQPACRDSGKINPSLRVTYSLTPSACVLKPGETYFLMVRADTPEHGETHWQMLVADDVVCSGFFC